MQGERRIASESIRNVGRDNATVMINVAGWSGSGRALEFDCDSPESALSLCDRLQPVRTDSSASWPRMSEGFDLMLKQYPHSDYLMNVYAYMACRAGEPERFHALNAKLKDRLSSTAWSARYSPEGCDKKFTGNGV